MRAAAAAAEGGSNAEGGSAGQPPPRQPERPRPPREPVDWEKTLGVRLPVWGGAIMLLIAGFFRARALQNWHLVLTPVGRAQPNLRR